MTAGSFFITKNIYGGKKTTMEIGINMDDREYELSDSDELLCEYGTDMEVGYLKINPERIPVVEGRKKAEESFERMGSGIEELPICNRHYLLIADRKNVEITATELIVTGTAYIARKQFRSYTELTAGEVEDWLEMFEASEEAGEAKPLFDYPVIVFEYDEEHDCFN